MTLVYPTDSPVPDYPLIWTPRWSTIISQFENGPEQRRQRRIFPAYDVTLNYSNIDDSSQLQILYDFFMQHHGSADSFFIYDLLPELVNPIPVINRNQFTGVGNGVLDTFDIPGRNVSQLVIYRNLIEVSQSEYTFLSGGGDGDSDRIQFNIPPSEGVVVSCDFTGALRALVRFSNDVNARELYTYIVNRMSINLTGLFPL